MTPLLISVMTCTRPGGVSYVEDTVAQITEELPGYQKVLICDGPSPSDLAGFEVVDAHSVRERSLWGVINNKEPAWLALKMAKSLGVGLLFCEDDVRRVKTGAFRKMVEHQSPDGVAFTSFFHRNRKPGIYHALEFEMSQAVLFPAEAARNLADFPTNFEGDWRAAVGCDRAMASCGHLMRWKYELTAPLISHVGEVSSIGTPRS